MSSKRLAVTTFLLAAGWAVSVSAGVTIADFGDDYVAGELGQTRAERSDDGWNYLWNYGGQIGDAANYVGLTWNTNPVFSSARYCVAGDHPGYGAARYAYLRAGDGHPGYGTDRPGVDFPHYAIGAYTLQADEGGLVQITNSRLGISSANSDGVELRVYVNDTPITRFVQPGGSSGSSGSGAFNVALGQLRAGDTVYVAMGPNVTATSDGFTFAYRLETVTDTTSAFWDPDGAGPVGGGSGTWNTSSSQWAAGVYGAVPYAAWDNAANKAAYFTGDAGTVTLGSAITARALSFDAAYTLAGTETLTLTGAGSGGPGDATIQVLDTADTVTISAPIASAAGLSKIGQGTLALTGATSITSGDFSAAGGTLRLEGSSSTEVAGTVVVGRSTVSGGRYGTLQIQDSAVLTAGHLDLGNSDRVSGTVVQSGGTVTIGGRLRIGHFHEQTSTYTLNGGSLELTGTPTGTVNPAGAAEQPGILYIGINGTGHFQQTGGTASAHGIVLDGRTETAADDTFTLTGGTFTVGPSGITSGSENANEAYQVNLGGGTLGASDNWSSSRLMDLTGTGGDTMFDTGGHTVTLSGELSGAGGLTKKGEGTLILSGGNSYNGLTTVAGGILKLDHTSALGTSVGTADGTVVQSGAALDMNGLRVYLNERITIHGAGTGAPNTGALFNGSGTSMGNDGARYLTLGGDASIGNDGGRFGLNGGTVSGPGFTLTKVGNNDVWVGSTVNVANVEIDGGNYGVQGAGALNSGGTITINPAGRLDTYTHGGFSGGTAHIVINGGQLRARGTGVHTALDLGGTVVLNGTNNRIDVVTNWECTLSGTISGGGDLTKIGSGKLILSNSNPYNGDTIISAGTLALDHASGNNISASPLVRVDANATLDITGLDNGMFILAAGQTLGGRGTVEGAVDVPDGAALSPGISLGTLNLTGDLALHDGAEWVWEFLQTGTAGVDYDSITGPALVLPENGKVELGIWGLEGYNLSAGDSFTLFQGDVYAHGADQPFAFGADLNHYFDITDNTGWWGDWKVAAGSLILTAVPEPGTWLMLLAALAYGLLVRRR